MLIFIENLFELRAGFVSLQCCAPSNVTDPETKISWTSDIDLFPKKGSCENISISVANNLTHNQARIFGTSSGNKWCYNLTTTTGRDYLIRGTFLHNSSPRTIPEIYFDVSLGATTITRVNSLVESLEVEGVFRATNDHVNFCLVKKEGNPYLSKLELRPLKELDYLKSDSSKLLKVIRRVDAGNTQGLIRHPYDVNDRIWNLDAIQSENISNINTIVSLANATIPVQVLHTALTDSKRLMFYYDDLDEGINEYQIILYFLELNDSIRIGQRVFDIYVNGVKKHENFDILENDQNTNYREVVLNTSANGVLNVSLVKVLDGIEFGPICNAYEIYQKVDLVEGTLQQDGPFNLFISPDFLFSTTVEGV
ncbi:hypothetical protein GIB67_003262 [Kingdonia uniflora]|uniref:Malectin-like domain-containing protein n=1 Tax=Kingdonia uniflora TaxID=39325 RepID=A0A7J7LXR9_9MAGN|nr:hypothetical protein GIB67_003262 [Kingdonia uniflora]